MFSKTRTIFVVGAGASVPYGFDTGVQLLRRAKKYSLESMIEVARRASGSEDGVKQLVSVIRETGDKSLDALLEFRPDLETAGKAFIAERLLAQERTCLVSGYECKNERDWFVELYQFLRTDTFEAFTNNQVGFITYNYDRFLEHRLIGALSAQFNRTTKECGEKIASMDIIHLHGTLGELPDIRGGDGAVPFGGGVGGGAVKDDYIQIATKAIRIVHQASPQDWAFQRARQLIAGAQRVIFLGFAFARQNVERLFLPDMNVVGIPMYACAYGITEAQQNTLVKSLFPQGALTTGLEDWDIFEFMRQFPGAFTP